MARSCELEPKTRSGTGRCPANRTGLAVAAFEHVGRRFRGLPLRRHVEQVDEEVVAQRARSLREHTVRRLPDVGAKDPQPADQHRHFGGAQRQQLGTIDQPLLGRMRVPARR